ncbi:MAG: hypothetical protein AAF228_09395 [Pseudomonadota bacterium]
MKIAFHKRHSLVLLFDAMIRMNAWKKYFDVTAGFADNFLQLLRISSMLTHAQLAPEQQKMKRR